MIERKIDPEWGVLSNNKDLIKSLRMSDNDNKCSAMSVTMSRDEHCRVLMLWQDGCDEKR